MAFLLLMVALLSTTGTFVYSASNKTNCNFMQNSKSCTQQSCVQPPCTMLCGLTTQYDDCQQLCGSRTGKCDTLKCLASNSCQQLCSQNNNCESLICDAKNCVQFCTQANCSNMVCHRTANSCSQGSGRKMICEANACTQICSTNYCQMTCLMGENNCTQTVFNEASAAMECDRGLCQQACSSGQCNMSCSSSKMAGRCEQVCSIGTCKSTVCDASNCSQVCVTGESNMNCPLGVKNCQQVAVDANVTTRCDADVCEQVCNKGNCNMTCSTSVKKCHQTCFGGRCFFRCDAENCKVDCFGDSSCTTIKRPTSSTATTQATAKSSADVPLQMAGYSVLGGLMLALIIQKKLGY